MVDVDIFKIVPYEGQAGPQVAVGFFIIFYILSSLFFINIHAVLQVARQVVAVPLVF